ncbi:MAG: hypothetical protein HFG80_05105 [Eubacterium sp.]|nr:hypothetical protein [Eubacterium sp.]
MKYVKIIVLAAVCVGLAVGYYFYLSTHSGGDSEVRKEQDNLSELESLLTENWEESYPPTPREVVKDYNRVLVCYYNENCEDKQIEKLVEMQRTLLDEELLQNNSLEDQVNSVKAEIAQYHVNERTVLDVTVGSSNETEIKEKEGKEYAYLTSVYLMKTGTEVGKTYQEYVLRKNEDGEWKILAFRLAEAPDAVE